MEFRAIRKVVCGTSYNSRATKEKGKLAKLPQT